MSGSSFGKIFKLTSFGESHGPAIGGIIEGFPPNISIDFEFIQNELNRRKTGFTNFSSSRKENDKVQFLSGIFEGKSIGTPIAFVVFNEDHKPKDYDFLKNAYRPSHADFTYEKKYGIRDYRGGGRASARETLSRVVGGAFSKIILKKENILVRSYVDQIGHIKHTNKESLDWDFVEQNSVRSSNQEISKEMEKLLLVIKKNGDTIGGSIYCEILGVPAGLGEPVFDKFQAELAKAMLSIPSVKGFEYGSGFNSLEKRGSELNDEWNADFTTKTNNSGGIQGGISNGMPIYFRVAFKPVATIFKDQNSVDKNRNAIILKSKGRHDSCVVPRAVPIVEAMAAMLTLDFLLRQKVNL
ncbi:MAG: chorismate synthase [Flavobacteriia bacterium]|nr:chorismate synthase [Flavobacteriia bacterium]